MSALCHTFPMPPDCDEWRRSLVAWYAKNRRELPWRKTRDPYAVWVSEVMLQQTQVATVVPYFERWMARFPTVKTLAESTEEQVLEIWQGLGYYRRAKLLRNGAQWVAQNGIPQSYQEWLNVPGIGPYTAAAISSISQGYPAAVVDGNVERVFARFRANSLVGASLLNAARQWSQEVLDTGNPGNWNQALMELGATICTPKDPKCDNCPIEEVCVALQTWTVDHYPKRTLKADIEKEEHLVWVPHFENRFGVRQIPEGQWWAGLWEFPRVNLTKGQTEEDLKALTGEGWLESLGLIRHQVTNHRILLEASLFRCGAASPALDWRTREELAQLPMPSPQRKVFARAERALGIAN